MASPATTADRYVLGEVADDQFGYAIAGVGDVIGSTYADLLIGAPFLDLDGTDAGRAYLFPGGSATVTDPSGLALAIDAEDWIQAGARTGDQFGFAVASAGDFDGDGVADYIVGAPQGNVITNATAGFCRVVDSGATAVANVLSLWNADWSADDGVRLEFQFSMSPAVITGIDLVREDLDATGDLMKRTLLWSGPAVPLTNLVDPRSGSVLYGLGMGYLFVDESPLISSSVIRYDLTAFDTDGEEMTFTALAGPGPAPAVNPVFLELAPAWPKPFNPTTQVKFRAAAGEPVRCRITDVRGRQVRDLYSGVGTGNWQTLTWNGLADDGATVASGVYLIHVESVSGQASNRVLLAK